MPLEIQNKFEKTKLWHLKTKLQFSGWLQYIIHGIWVIFLLILTSIGWLIGYWPIILFWTPLTLATLLGIALLGTILTVKYGLHPKEKIPKRNDALDAFSLMRKRHSCRSFQSRKLIKEHYEELIAIIKVYSNIRNQISHLPIRFEYVFAPLRVWPVVGASEFLVAIAPKKYNRLAMIDIGRSLQKIVNHATKMGLATCWIGPGADQTSIIKHLGSKFNSEQDHVICVCAIGYESMFKPLFIRFMQKLQHKRLPLSQLFFINDELVIPANLKEKPFNEYDRCYEACQWSPSSYNGQTTRCVLRLKDHKLIRVDFFTSTRSKYYAPLALGIWCANWELGCIALNKKGVFVKLAPKDSLTSPSHKSLYNISWIPDLP